MKLTIRIATFFVFVGLFSAAYQIGGLTEVPIKDAVAILEEFEEIIGDIDGIGIFLHNSYIALPMFIPGFGIAWGFFSAYSTGYAFSALSMLIPGLEEIPALALLYLSPFGVMELVAYSIGTSRSFLLIHKIIKKTSIKPDWKITSIEVGIVLGLLLVGGILEHYLIELAAEGGFEMFS